MSRMLLLDSPVRNFPSYLEAVEDLRFIGWKTTVRELYELGIRAVQRSRMDRKELMRCVETFLREGLFYDVRGQQEEDLLVMTMQSVFMMVERDMAAIIFRDGLSNSRISVEKYDEAILVLRVR